MYRYAPCRITIKGDTDAGRALIGIAKKKMNILENQMRFQKLSQGWMTKEIDGVVYELWSSFNLRQITITVKTGAQGAIGKKYEMSCFCNNCLAVGMITAFNNGQLATQDEIDDPGTTTYPDYYCSSKEWIKYPYFYYTDELCRYDVTLCGRKDEFVLVENCRPSDHTPHCIGDIVLCALQPVSESDTFSADACYKAGGCEIGDCPDTVNDIEGIYYVILPFGNLPSDLIDQKFTINEFL